MESCKGLAAALAYLHLHQSWRLAQGGAGGGRIWAARVVRTSVTQTLRRGDWRPETRHRGGRRVARLEEEKGDLIKA